MIKILVLSAFAFLGWTVKGIGPSLALSIGGAHVALPVLACAIVGAGVFVALAKVRR